MDKENKSYLNIVFGDNQLSASFSLNIFGNGLMVICRHEGGLFKFLHSILVSLKFRANSAALKNSKEKHTSLKILRNERELTMACNCPSFPLSQLLLYCNAELCLGHHHRYCDNYVRRKLHWNHMCSILALSVLLVVGSAGQRLLLFICIKWIGLVAEF